MNSSVNQSDVDLHTNIIVVNVPYRYDLPVSSSINRELSIFNKKLEKCLKSVNCITLITTNCIRTNFTKHGMHLYNIGKLETNKVAKTSV
jgi:hypothetical protein